MANTFEDIKAKIEPALQFLKSCNDFSQKEAYEAITNLNVTLIATDRSIGLELGKYLIINEFGQLVVKILKTFRDGTSDKGPDGKPNLGNIKAVCGNLTTSQQSDFIRLELVKCGVTGILLEELEEDACKEVKTGHDLRPTIDTLNVLSNCVKCQDDTVRTTLRGANAVAILMKFLKSKELILMVKSLSILAYLVNEKESTDLAATEQCIAQLIELVRVAAQTKDYKLRFTVRGRSYTEGIYELLNTINHLAVKDAGKKEIVKSGGVPVITQILHVEALNHPLYPRTVVETLWKLAFVESHVPIITRRLQDTDTMKILTQLQSSDNAAVSDASTGLLWTLGFIDVHLDVQQEEDLEASYFPWLSCRKKMPWARLREDLGTPQLMISYQRSNQKQALRLRDKLEAAGINVWLDVDKLESNLLTGMQAVSRSTVMLMCMSQSYKESVQCQTEATYARKLQKEIIPILVEQDYLLDGWLKELTAPLIADKVPLKRYTDDAEDEETSQLIDEIRKRCCATTPTVQP